MSSNLHQMAVDSIVAAQVSVAIAVISWIIAKEEIARPLRDPCTRFTQGNVVLCKKLVFLGRIPCFALWAMEAICRRIAYIPTCELCTSIWVAALFLWKITPLRIGSLGYPSLIETLFILVGLANLDMSIYSRVRVEIQKDKAETEHTMADSKKIAGFKERSGRRP